MSWSDFCVVCTPNLASQHRQYREMACSSSSLISIGGDCASRCGMTSIRPYRCIDFGVSGIGNRSVPTTASFKRENINRSISKFTFTRHI